jgi:hypothetical protein
MWRICDLPDQKETSALPIDSRRSAGGSVFVGVIPTGVVLAFFSSWPGLTRPSRFFLKIRDFLDGRLRGGHDGMSQ